MKKIIRLSVFFISIVLLLASCNLTIEDEYKLSSPTCDVDAGNCISISIKKSDSDTKYINIYRQDISNENHPGEITNVGIIFPPELKDETAVNQYKDFNVLKGHTYKYYVRLSNGNEYTKSQWSNAVKVPSSSSCYPEETIMTYRTGSAYFEYNSTDYTLKVVGTILNPEITDFDKFYKPAIIVKTAERTETFILPDISDGSTISLRGILSSKFLDTNVTLVGICGEKIERDDTLIDVEESLRPVKRITWSEAAEIRVRGKEVNNNTIFIPAASNSIGMDYSRQLNKF